jgi:hypothetical protein
MAFAMTVRARYIGEWLKTEARYLPLFFLLP